jgi:hypothetical protein
MQDSTYVSLFPSGETPTTDKPCTSAVFTIPTDAECEAEFRSTCMRFSGLDAEQQEQYLVLTTLRSFRINH